ncbi:MAG: FKBP-type peptidyl-prolyl cis-trans isomerase [Chitinophaga sp.]|uniref:FKBP-type peptidyl-prolyl cis-trans isomerase n=1 Tax=Chitinophaga sp. TaxID=1869181 RepID=UPI001B296826|nr:FKBP-type peptidyl-prolyl cis-trans isomerase [Chitinophaga sp.]MBO9728177.1 FKBP-type peptidyl-prolyl cis-trans isomerase [Chitinophaga sp.]
MKKAFLFGSLFLLFLAACTKKKEGLPAYNWQAQYTIDSTKIVTYAVNNNITNLKHDSAGIFYQIINRGDTKDTANTAATVTINYVCRFLDNSVYDSVNNATSGLNGALDGLKYGIPKIGKGGSIKLLLPSAFAYGQMGNTRVPPNTVLIFDIQLKDFTNR